MQLVLNPSGIMKSALWALPAPAEASGHSQRARPGNRSGRGAVAGNEEAGLCSCSNLSHESGGRWAFELRLVLCSEPATQGCATNTQMVLKDVLMVTTSVELLPLAKSRFEHFPHINVFNPHTNAVGRALSSTVTLQMWKWRQRESGTCPRSHCWWVAELGFRLLAQSCYSALFCVASEMTSMDRLIQLREGSFHDLEVRASEWSYLGGWGAGLGG